MDHFLCKLSREQKLNYAYPHNFPLNLKCNYQAMGFPVLKVLHRNFSVSSVNYGGSLIHIVYLSCQKTLDTTIFLLLQISSAKKHRKIPDLTKIYFSGLRSQGFAQTSNPFGFSLVYINLYYWFSVSYPF